MNISNDIAKTLHLEPVLHRSYLDATVNAFAEMTSYINDIDIVISTMTSYIVDVRDDMRRQSRYSGINSERDLSPSWGPMCTAHSMSEFFVFVSILSGQWCIQGIYSCPQCMDKKSSVMEISVVTALNYADTNILLDFCVSFSSGDLCMVVAQLLWLSCSWRPWPGPSPSCVIFSKKLAGTSISFIATQGASTTARLAFNPAHWLHRWAATTNWKLWQAKGQACKQCNPSSAHSIKVNSFVDDASS